MKNILTLLLALLALNAPAITLSKEATISVLTCSPGDEMYSLFGHTGIRVTDPAQGLDIVFNYGTFDFDTQGFYLKFARGLLPYQLSISRFRYFKAAYEEERRSIYSQTLRLDSVQKQRLMNLLEENYRPENRSYLYNFLYDNCSTRVRDIIEKSLGGEVEWRTREKDKSFWNLLDEYMAPSRKSGTPWYLSPGFVFPACVLLLAGLLQRVKGRRLLKAAAFPFFLVSGVIGCLLIFLGYFTAHPTTAPNFNLVWANPLNLPVAFLLIKKRIPWLARKYLLVYLCMLAAGFACWFLLTPAVLYSTLAVIAWMAYLSYRLQKL